MWYLTSETDNRVIYIIPPSEITIGRSADAQVCNFAIPDDPSLSRKHATLIVTENKLVLQELGSRYGTYINNSAEKVEGNVTLNNADVIKFGKMNSVWTVHSTNLITCTSTLKGENLQNMRAVLSKIGGTFKSDWDETCNFLTMPAITLTIKVVLALVQRSHIVTTEYWNSCLEAINNSLSLPDPSKFVPEVMESTLNKEFVSFLPDNRRQTLFKGKKIIFLARRQFEMYKTVLTAGSALPMLLSESKMTPSMLAEKDIIVIQYLVTNASQDTQVQRNQINEIVNYLKSKGKRTVADAEIGLAILYCSLDKYCNPDFSFTTEVVKQTELNNKTSNVLAPESQDPSKTDSSKGSVVINESLVADIDKNSKRKFDESSNDFQSNPNKKLATLDAVTNTSSNNDGNKRKLEDNESSTNPTKKLAVDNDVFNFVNNSTSSNDKNKKLNLLKPQKRKVGGGDGLFNFIETDEDASAAETSKRSMFDVDIVEDVKPVKVEKIAAITPEEVVAMRGSKLKELMESNLSYNSNTDLIKFKIKKEKCDELEEKMSELDLGCTIVITCSDLIVKKEPIYKTEDENITVKNFKKFKKVWPLKRRMIPTSSTSVVA